MSTLLDVLKKLPPGCYAHPLVNFVNGTVTTSKDGHVTVPLRLSIESLGSPYSDLRAVTLPHGNKIVPILLFVEVEAHDAAIAAQEKGSGA